MFSVFDTCVCNSTTFWVQCRSKRLNDAEMVSLRIAWLESIFSLNSPILRSSSLPATRCFSINAFITSYFLSNSAVAWATSNNLLATFAENVSDSAAISCTARPDSASNAAMRSINGVIALRTTRSISAWVTAAIATHRGRGNRGGTKYRSRALLVKETDAPLPCKWYFHRKR